MSEDVRICQVRDMDKGMKRGIDKIIREEFGDIPIIRNTEWSAPDWQVVLLSGKLPVSFLGIVERRARFDGSEVALAGVSNFITVAPERGAGLGTQVLTAAQRFMRENLGVDWGLLLCSEDVVPFYLKLGWHRTHAKLTYDQPSGKRQWMKAVLLYPVRSEIPPDTEIDLCGAPW